MNYTGHKCYFCKKAISRHPKCWNCHILLHSKKFKKEEPNVSEDKDYCLECYKFDKGNVDSGKVAENSF